jgi:toxin FitB
LTRFLFDTNVVSELRKPRPHGAVLQWVGGLMNEQIFLSTVSLGEIQIGIERARRQDPEKAREIEEWAERLVLAHRILPMDTECFLEWGRLMEGKLDRILADAMIAATARVHDLVVATRNKRDFESFHVRIFNPFAAR